jgi:hypothetical protein
MSPARVHINKYAAAERQLKAAIRLYFADEDELAVHTVAAATYQLLADLLKDRGFDVAADHYLTSFFYAVRDYHRGTLPDALKTNPQFNAWVADIAEQLPIGPDTAAEDVKVELSEKVKLDFWKHRHATANFLKHADRDSGGHLALDEVDNLLLLMQCYGAHFELSKAGLGNEGLAFGLFIDAMNPPTSTSSDRDRILQNLSTASDSTRRRFCSAMIRDLNAIDAAEA